MSLDQKYRINNQTVWETMQPGDILKFKRKYYNHYGVVVANKQVVHLSGDGDGISGRLGFFDSTKAPMSSVPAVVLDKAGVCLDDFWDIVGDSEVEIDNSGDAKFRPLTPAEIVMRAMSKIGEEGYNVLFSNCEHFAKWCRYNNSVSEQVETALTWGAVFVGAVALAGMAFSALKPNKTTTVSDVSDDEE